MDRSVLRPDRKAMSLHPLLLLLALVASGCSGTMTTVGRKADRATAQMFPISSEAADKLVATAISSEFAGSPVSRVEFPNKGYQATMRFALDSHTIVAYMIPAKGRAGASNDVDGFVFEVSHSGTMPISGSSRARKVFKRIVQDATLVSPPLPLTSFAP